MFTFFFFMKFHFTFLYFDAWHLHDVTSEAVVGCKNFLFYSHFIVQLGIFPMGFQNCFLTSQP